MKCRNLKTGLKLVAIVSGLTASGFAQQASSNSAIPQLVNYGGVLTDIHGKPLSGVAGVTFSLYSEESGGAPLWSEIQNVQMGKGGYYAVMLGSASSTGLPRDVFVSGEARWLGVRAEGQAEQPRVLLVAVPYALKAGDAQTIGGLPASAFVLANGSQATAVPPANPAAGSNAVPSNPRPDSVAAAQPAAAGIGTQDYLPIWTDSVGDLGNSVLYQSGTGSSAKIGVNTATPAATLDVKGAGIVRGTLTLPATGVATATAGKDSQPLSLAASAFNSGLSTSVSQTFQLKAEPVGNDTAAASGVLSLLYGSGANAPVETGLQIAGNGLVTFASGQTFPGAGTVTSVGAGAGLTGGPITTSGTLSIAAGGVSNAMLAHPSLTVAAGGGMTGGGSVSLGGSTTLGLKTCSANQVLEYISSVWTCTTISGGGTITGVTAGTDLTGGGASGTVTLNLDTTKVPQLGTANTFAGTQTIGSGDVSVGSGNLDLPDTTAASAGVINLGGSAFLHQCCNTSSGYTNTFLGRDAGNFSTTGGYNTASGYGALFLNGTGTDNTASGYVALDSNGTGNYNTANGDHALYSNTTGSNNTASGAGALYVNIGGSGNTAVGFNAGSDVHRSVPASGANSTFVGANANATVDNLTNATAIGYNAQVGESNALVLGSGAMVGIGTPTPQYALDVHGSGNFTGAVTVAGLTAGNCVQAGTGGLLTTTASPCGGGGGGGGTVTSVGTGLGLTGGPITASGTLSIDTTKVPQLAAANTFNASQTINGNLTATGAVSASTFQTGGYILALGSHPAQNVFFGFAGNTTMTGLDNTASGASALQDNTSGSYNTASGDMALLYNTTGSYNTAVGLSALQSNSSGAFNTAIGNGAGITADYSYITGDGNTLVGTQTMLGTGTLTNATAIGAFAEVTESNALVLGQISTPAHPSNTSVGIGTTAPLAALDVAGYQLETFIGNPECGAHAFAGIAFGSFGFQSCGNYSMVGDGVNTYIGAPTGDIYFRTQNNTVTAMTIDQYGDVNIAGNLSKGGGSFKIDHPRDPANKYLYHSFVESPDMMNIYNGVIIVDANGEASVALPDWFEALNRDFRYQLTPIGAPGPNLYIAEEVANNQFKIAGGKPGSKVSWQVTGIRHDAYANAHRIPTEVEKPPQEQGRYLHPELFGAGPELAVESNERLSSTRTLAAVH